MLQRGFVFSAGCCILDIRRGFSLVRVLRHGVLSLCEVLLSFPLLVEHP